MTTDEELTNWQNSLATMPDDVLALECEICDYRNEVQGVDGYEESVTHIIREHFKISEKEWGSLPVNFQIYITFTLADRLLKRIWMSEDREEKKV